MDISTFLSADKSMIIAPAGYGKTYTIAECIASYDGKKKILVLTHTHAGVASLREKFNQKQLSPSSYHLETICSFALNLTRVFHINKDEMPQSSDAGALFLFAVERATKILRAQPIKRSIFIKYDHLIVDEYQDCTTGQHQMIMALSNTLKTHILGDPLQGIFGFRRESIVNFSDASFAPFNDNCQTLDIPWRWNNAGKNALGQELSSIRSKLLSSHAINLQDFSEIEWVQAPENDYATPRSLYKDRIFNALREDSVLLIHPASESIEPRIKFIQQFPQLKMVESIDDKIFYSSCLSFDNSSGYPLIATIVNLMRKVGAKTQINVWFNDAGGLKNKRSAADQQIRRKLETVITSLVSKKSYADIALLIEAIAELPYVRIYRTDCLRDICQTLRDAARLGISATKSIDRNRNILRKRGRKVQGRGIGTTLLTKGLEFDTVVILNAQRFTDKKHLYVALTRCCKRLIIISNNPILNPNQ
jgi:hypothetical protein